MKEIDKSISYKPKDLDHELKSAYASAIKNPEFKKLVNTLKVKDNMAYKYTSKLERTVGDLNNCQDCKSLNMCKNRVVGMVYYPTINGDRLEFNYVACKYMKKHLKEEEDVKSKFYKMPHEIRMAKISDIEVDKSRTKVIKWLKKFYDTFKKDQNVKGLYLHGSFGSGKTYLVSAFLNELAKDAYSTVIVYYPELLRSLKDHFNSEDYPERIEEIKRCDILLLDDIGAETISTWNRDEILGTILQYRMDNKKCTFFTSNLSLDELESHLIISKTAEEKIKARRIMERIKQLTDEEVLVGENRRK